MQELFQPPYSFLGVVISLLKASVVVETVRAGMTPPVASPPRSDASGGIPAGDSLPLPPRVQAIIAGLGLGFIGKYLEPLFTMLGDRLLFPEEFIGRGDMSRGGLLLRCVRSGEELRYVPAGSATYHGKRPPRLPGARGS